MKKTLVPVLVILSVLVAQPIQASLIAHLSFDDSGNLAEDSSGLSNNAQSISNVSFSPSGKFGGAAVFNASSQSNLLWSGLSDPIANVVGGDFSVSTWVNTTQESGSDTSNAFDVAAIVYSDVPGFANDTIPIAITGSKLGFFTSTSSSSFGNTSHSSSDINIGSFVHLAVTRSLITGEKNIYIDGVLESTVIDAAGVPLNDRHELVIGGNTSDIRYFTGILDDVRIYDHTLTENEVSELFNPAGVPTPSSLFLIIVGVSGLRFFRIRLSIRQPHNA